MRLREIRINHQKTQKELAEHLGSTIRAIAYYESGSREPNIATLIAIADYFGVSIDYLVGRTDNPQRL